MQVVKGKFDELKGLYDGTLRQGANRAELHAEINEGIIILVEACQSLRRANSTSARFGPPIDERQYFVAEKDPQKRSRPYRTDWLLEQPGAFRAGWEEFTNAADPTNRRYSISADTANTALYTAITEFCLVYDLWANSRKTPGTFFEVLLGATLARVLPGYNQLKHLPIPGVADGTDQEVDDDSISTDIVFAKGTGANQRGIVIPAKITTRERIVQPYAHQRIVDCACGEGKFKSVLICVSELQRDDVRTRTNEICVPGTVKLFQRYLSRLSGIVYLDPPIRYLKKDVTDLVAVKTLGEFVTSHLRSIT